MFSDEIKEQKASHKLNRNSYSKKVHRKMDKSRILTEISDMYLKGKTQREIAEVYGFSIATVSLYIEEIRQEWRESRVINFSEMQQVELMKLDKMEAELWRAWELSKSGIVKRTRGAISRTGKMGGEETFNEEEVIESKGEIKYMEAIIKIVAARIRLLGLDAPIKVEGLFAVKQETLLTKADLTDEERMQMFNVLIASVQKKQLPSGGDDNADRIIEADARTVEPVRDQQRDSTGEGYFVQTLESEVG